MLSSQASYIEKGQRKFCGKNLDSSNFYTFEAKQIVYYSDGNLERSDGVGGGGGKVRKEKKRKVGKEG